MKKQMDTTQEVFDRLLSWLDEDRDEAGKKYEKIRLRLIKIFGCRGCGEAEDLADDTINRVTAKVSEIAPTYEGDPALYFYGVARKVHHEYVRTQNRIAPSPSPIDDITSDDEHVYQCLDRCMDRLPEENRQLVLRYYQAEKKQKIENRNCLAAEMGIAVNALRIRAHRIRKLLKECVKACVSETDSLSYS
jgi:DNA-directed RNA polymerase specialized sigma24 family protein